MNAVAEIRTHEAPDAILRRLHGVEQVLGRTRKLRWEARVCDIDIVAIDDLVLPDKPTSEAWINLPLIEQQNSIPDELILPHPRMHERAFVLVPMAEIAPDGTHPILQKTVSEMLRLVPETDVRSVLRLKDI